MKGKTDIWKYCRVPFVREETAEIVSISSPSESSSNYLYQFPHGGRVHARIRTHTRLIGKTRSGTVTSGDRITYRNSSHVAKGIITMTRKREVAKLHANDGLPTVVPSKSHSSSGAAPFGREEGRKVVGARFTSAKSCRVLSTNDKL